MDPPKTFSQFKNAKRINSEDLFINKETWETKEECWSKNKENVIIICGDACWVMSKAEYAKFEKFVNILKKMESQNKPINTEVKLLKMEGKKTMLKNFVIGSRDAGLVIGSLAKAKEAKPAVKAVKEIKEVIAIAAVPEKKDPKTGKVIQKKVKAVKGVKGVKAAPAIPAQPATPEVRTVILKCRTEGIAQEVIARMADQGYEMEGEVKYIGPGTFDLTYKAESDKPIRAAFKKCKSKDGYNKPGLAALAAAKKAEVKAKKVVEDAKETTVSGKKKGDDSVFEEAPIYSKKKGDNSALPGELGWPES